jgi:hypothetical protein
MIRLKIVDFPTLGLPMMATTPRGIRLHLSNFSFDDIQNRFDGFLDA